MIKLGDPTGNGIIYITQTLHGEGSKLPNMQCAVDIRMYANEYFHSPCDGLVKAVDTRLGGYIAITPDNFNGYVLLVHVDRFQVGVGQRVVKGQILGQIANLGANSHLHLGMKWNDAHLPAPNPMDYFDREIPFKASFQDIAKEWFKGNINGDIDWSLFRDLSLDGNNMTTR